VRLLASLWFTRLARLGRQTGADTDGQPGDREQGWGGGRPTRTQRAPPVRHRRSLTPPAAGWLAPTPPRCGAWAADDSAHRAAAARLCSRQAVAAAPRLNRRLRCGASSATGEQLHYTSIELTLPRGGIWAEPSDPPRRLTSRQGPNPCRTRGWEARTARGVEKGGPRPVIQAVPPAPSTQCRRSVPHSHGPPHRRPRRAHRHACGCATKPMGKGLDRADRIYGWSPSHLHHTARCQIGSRRT